MSTREVIRPRPGGGRVWRGPRRGPRGEGDVLGGAGRPLTLARWGTDAANGAAAAPGPDAGGVLTVPGRRRDRGAQAQVVSARPGPRAGPFNAINRRQSEPVSVNGHGWTAGSARTLECSRRVAGRIRLGCWAVRQSGRAGGSTGQNHCSSYVRAEARLPAGQFRAGP